MRLRDTCWLCGSRQIKDLYRVNGFTVAKCGQCALCFVREAVDDDAIQEIYALGSAQNEMLATKKVYLDRRNEKNLKYAYAALAKRIRAYFLHAAGEQEAGAGRRRILDLGCSTGAFFDFFPDWDVYGVELEETAGAIAKQKHENIRIGDMAQAEFGEDFFDCVTVLDSLDHSNSPMDVARHCRRQLKPGGLLVVKAHNIDCLLAKLSGKRYYAIMPPVHLSFFSLKTLKRLLSACGFQCVDHYYNWQKLRLDTAILRASGTFPFLARVYKGVSGRWIGKLPVYKNFHDIVTVMAIKR